MTLPYPADWFLLLILLYVLIASGAMLHWF